MTAELSVYFTEPAPVARAQWLRALLEPVAVACRFERPPPLEVRATGNWGGWAADRTSAPDGRVCVSSRVCFWTREAVVHVVLHEWAHRALQSDRDHSGLHGPQFFCLNSIFLLRAARFFEGDPLVRMGLYDLQDQPDELAHEPGWRGLVIDWALSVAAELADTDASAEDLGHIVCARWNQFIDDRHALHLMAQREAVKGALLAQTRVAELEDLLSSRSLWRAVAMVGWVSFAAVCWLVFKGAHR